MNQPPPTPTIHAPQPRADMPNLANYQPDQELLRLRRRIGDLMRMNALTPETFQQAVMQLFQESERRRQTCLQEAEDHLRKYHALLSQAGAFAAQGSILFAVINGFATLEERRLQEMADREREKAQQEAAAPPAAPAPAPAPEPAPANGTPTAQPAQEATGTPATKTSGGRRKKA